MINEEEGWQERERKKKETLLQLLFVLHVYNTKKLSYILWVVQCEVLITKHYFILCRFLYVKLTGFKCIHYSEQLMHYGPLNEPLLCDEIHICQTLKCNNYFCYSLCCLEGQARIANTGFGGCGVAVIGAASQQYILNCFQEQTELQYCQH